MNEPTTAAGVQAAERRIAAVLLDLDGTLADTAPDMIGALNRLLAEHSLESLPASFLRPHVSHGAKALIGLGFGDDLDAARFDALRLRFLELYADMVCRDTRLFPGFESVLDQLDLESRPWGVVTNKPGWLATPLIEQLGLQARIACLVSGDTVARNKPDPMPLQYAAETIGMGVDRCLYIGDAERDIVAGRAAGMPVLVAGWGYLGEHDRPETWGADGIIAHPAELLSWLDPRHGAQHVS